jgi:hypothetical protein
MPLMPAPGAPEQVAAAAKEACRPGRARSRQRISLRAAEIIENLEPPLRGDLEVSSSRSGSKSMPDIPARMSELRRPRALRARSLAAGAGIRTIAQRSFLAR